MELPHYCLCVKMTYLFSKSREKQDNSLESLIENLVDDGLQRFLRIRSSVPTKTLLVWESL